MGPFMMLLSSVYDMIPAELSTYMSVPVVFSPLILMYGLLVAFAWPASAIVGGIGVLAVQLLFMGAYSLSEVWRKRR